MPFINIIKANARITELEADKESLTKALAEINKENDTLKTDVQEAATEIAAAKKALEDAKAEHAKQIDALKAEAAANLESANQKAAQTLASIGVPEGTVKETTEPSGADILAQFNSLSGEAQTAFWKKNQVAIRRALNSR